jgi:type IV pilus assembly protein PilM
LISEPPPDRLFEIAESSLSAVTPRTPTQIKQEWLHEVGLLPSPAAPNVISPEVFREALEHFYPGPAERRAGVAVVIPDYAVRMAILDFEEFPPGETERLALLRFRLRKTVPFHVDEAQLAYSIQLNEGGRIEVLAVAIARPILEEYEGIFTDAGYRVGLVLPSSIAALPLCSDDAKGLTLLTKISGLTLTLVLLEKGQVRLVRCLDLAEESESRRRDIHSLIPLLQQTVAFAEDQIGRPVAQILFCGFGDEMHKLGKLAESEFHIPYGQVRSKFGPLSQGNAGLLGLLEQYAA